MTAYDDRQAILNASPEWRFRCAVDRFERVIRGVAGHIARRGAEPLPESLWAEERIARRELMALDPYAGMPSRHDHSEIEIWGTDP